MKTLMFKIKTIGQLNLLILIILISIFSGCQKQKPQVFSTYVLIDETDCNSLIKKVTPKWLKLITKGENDLDGRELSLITIGDKRHNPELKIELIPQHDVWEYNEFDRRKLINAFDKRIEKQAMDFIHNQPKKANQSQVFYTLFKTINQAIGTGNNSDIYVVSDLRNNSKEFNSYNSEVMALVEQNPDSLGRLLNREFPIDKQPKNNQKIKVHFLYEPLNASQDDAFELISQFLKNYLTNMGIQVQISSSLTNNYSKL